MKFNKWKKNLKKVHQEHVKNMIIVNDPKASLNKKYKARNKLKDLEDMEMQLENKRYMFHNTTRDIKKMKRNSRANNDQLIYYNSKGKKVKL